MRAIDCDCGHHLEAEDDEALFQEGKKHVAEVHADMNMSDEQVRELIATKAYDV